MRPFEWEARDGRVMWMSSLAACPFALQSCCEQEGDVWAAQEPNGCGIHVSTTGWDKRSATTSTYSMYIAVERISGLHGPVRRILYATKRMRAIHPGDDRIDLGAKRWGLSPNVHQHWWGRCL